MVGIGECCEAALDCWRLQHCASGEGLDLLLHSVSIVGWRAMPIVGGSIRKGLCSPGTTHVLLPMHNTDPKCLPDQWPFHTSCSATDTVT